MTYPLFLEDQKKRPYPQFWNEVEGRWEVNNGEQGAFSVYPIGSLMVDSIEKTGSYTYNAPEPLRGLSIINDGEADVTFTVNGITVKLKGGEMFDRCLREFTQVTFTTTTSTYRVVFCK